MTITVSEGLGYLKALNARYAELKALRDENANTERRFYGVGGDKQVEKIPVYSVKKLDRTVNRIAMAIRKIDASIKRHNAVSVLEGVDWDEEVLGLIETE